MAEFRHSCVYNYSARQPKGSLSRKLRPLSGLLGNEAGESLLEKLLPACYVALDLSLKDNIISARITRPFRRSTKSGELTPGAPIGFGVTVLPLDIRHNYLPFSKSDLGES